MHRSTLTGRTNDTAVHSGASESRRTSSRPAALLLLALVSWPASAQVALVARAASPATGRTEMTEMHERPFMEHPSGDFKTAIDAMEDAIRRLRVLPKWAQWIAFNAQGRGASAEDVRAVEVRLLRDAVDVGKAVKPERVARLAKVKASAFVPAGQHYSIAHATPREAALLLDALFRHELGLRPFPHEGDDYAVGAEW